MKIDWIEEKVPAELHNNGRDLIYRLHKLNSNFVVKPLDEDNLWCVWEIDPETVDEEGYLWGKFAIMKVRSRTIHPKPEIDDTALDVLWHGEGPIPVLRELRHAYFGDNGYMFYLNKKDITTSFEYLSRYYDME